MEITIQIDCETIADLHAHLHELQKQIREKARKLKLSPLNEMFPVPDNHDGADMDLYDDNCYGEHGVWFKEN